MSATETAPALNGKPTEDAHANLPEALIAIQRDMPAVERDGSSHHGKYTTLGHLLAKAKPVLSQHGVAVCQFPSMNHEGRPTLRTLLIHESGDTLESEALLSPVKNDPQSHGSALTYMRRYALAAALGISDQEDKDGQTPGGRRSQAPTLDKAKVAELKAAFKKFKEDHEGRFTYNDLNTLLGGLGIDGLNQFNAQGFESRLRSLSSAEADVLGEALAR